MNDASRVTVVDGKVSALNDKAGARHLSTAVARRPTYADVGSLKGAQINHGVLPNGQNGLDLIPFTAVANYTTVVAFRMDAAAANTGFNSVYKAGTVSLQVGADGGMYIGPINTYSGFPTFKKFQPGQVVVVAWKQAGTSVTVFVDGEQLGTTGTIANGAGMDQIHWGLTSGAAGWSTVIETITYNRSDVSAADIRSLYAGLKTKLGAR